MTEAESARPADTYRGLIGAFPYAARASTSSLFRSYVLIGGLLALGIVILFGLGVISLLGATAGTTGGTFALSRGLYLLVMVAIFAPLVTPVLLVARRHRQGNGDGRYDLGMAVTGYLYVVSLYVGFVITIPPEHQPPVDGALAPVLLTLYRISPFWGILPPAVAVAVIVVVHRQLR